AREEAALLPAGKTAQDVGGHLPGARCRPGIHVRRRVGIMEKRRLEAQEGDDLGTNSSLYSPFAPVHEVGLEVEMHETVPQRPRHREVDTAFRGRIAGR